MAAAKSKIQTVATKTKRLAAAKSDAPPPRRSPGGQRFPRAVAA